MSLISLEGSLGVFQRHNRFICSDPSCRFGYLKRWSVCQRSLGSDRRCGAPLVDPSLVLVAVCDVPESPVVSSSSLPCSLSSVRSSPERMISVAVQAAIDHHLPAELTSNETLIFDTFISRLCLLHVHSIQHVPRMARPLLASCLSQEFSAVNQFGLWSFARILMFAKLVLRSPPHAGRKKRYLVGSLVAERLSQWRSGAGIMSLWQDACAEATPPGDTVASEDVLARDNVRRALQWASHGRYGNALQALGSKGVAPFTDITAREELLRCHPQSSLPSHTSYVPPPLVVQSSTILAALRSFPRGTSPGSFGLRPQHLLDAVCGNTAPAASGCLQALTRCVNILLSGRLDCRVAPWFCGAPLTALIKPGGGVHPIAVGETLRRLVSKVCCLAVRSALPDVFLPFGQVGVGVSGGLEAAIHSLRTILSTLGSKPDLCCLKVDMSNAFNECNRSSFLSRCKFVFPELFAWIQWCYCCAGELRFGPHHILSTTGVQQGDPLGPLLFSTSHWSSLTICLLAPPLMVYFTSCGIWMMVP